MEGKIKEIVKEAARILRDYMAFPNEKTHSFRGGMIVRSVKGWLLSS